MRQWPGDWPLVMLHSGRLDADWSRYSILASPTGAFRFSEAADQGGARGPNGSSDWLGEPMPDGTPSWEHRPLANLRQVLGRDPHSLWVGYLSYDLGRFLETLPEHAARDRDWPIVAMQRCPGWLVHDAMTGQWYVCGEWAAHGPPRLSGEAATGTEAFGGGETVSACSASEYVQRVQRVKDCIAAGDAFQVNLAQRFSATFSGSPRGLFQQLAAGSPAWYGAYVELLHKENEPRRTLCSTSPELFLQVDADGRVVTRPIKGTRPATASPAELAASEKDAAELHMIVDLLRNDLGRVCDYGSMRVTQPRTIESHPTVHHGVATIEGRLHESKGVVDLLKAAMPGGSITGAPKVRAMQIIDELEPVRRGPYCGAIGYMLGGEAQFNIAIRTMLVEQPPRSNKQPQGGGRVDYSVGGGIVADSDLRAEYDESLDKAQAMQNALGGVAKVPQGGL